jgi:hypothetical protein
MIVKSFFGITTFALKTFTSTVELIVAVGKQESVNHQIQQKRRIS